MTITRGSLVYHCVLSIYYIYIHVLSITVWIIPSPSGGCVFLIPLVYFFRFFSVYISLFCIYYLVWLCIAFFWFNCYYQKPLYEKTENWSSLEWSKEVYLFRAWLTRTLNNGYTCKLHLYKFYLIDPCFADPSQFLSQLLSQSVSWLQLVSNLVRYSV